ncbi:MAG TPA: hypothetical protein VMK65_00745, partial [Longimicrobiales bacterium]|nr:hypothetical protein [Longimicrobiales bacterium]
DPTRHTERVHSMSSIIMAAVQAASSGLTLREVFADIPHDAAAIVVYLMLGAFIVLIARAGRAKKPRA